MAEMQKKKDDINYSYVGEKDSLFKSIARALPKGATPTKKTGHILSGILLIVFLIGLLSSGAFAILGGNTHVEIRIGIPFTFLHLSFGEGAENSPVKIPGLIFDMIIYILLAYLIDIAFNIFLNKKFIKTEEDKNKILKIYEDKK